MEEQYESLFFLEKLQSTLEGDILARVETLVSWVVSLLGILIFSIFRGVFSYYISKLASPPLACSHLFTK